MAGWWKNENDMRDLGKAATELSFGNLSAYVLPMVEISPVNTDENILRNRIELPGSMKGFVESRVKCQKKCIWRPQLNRGHDKSLT